MPKHDKLRDEDPPREGRLRRVGTRSDGSLGAWASPLLVVILLLPGCFHQDVRSINVDDLFWNAWRNPETFDRYLASTTVDPEAPNCLRSHAEQAFRDNQRRLLECGQILQGSPQWNECHQDAENAHNRGVVLNDIARSAQGQISFAGTEGGRYLILAKSLLGQAAWYQLADTLRANTPPLECEAEASATPFWML